MRRVGNLVIIATTHTQTRTKKTKPAVGVVLEVAAGERPKLGVAVAAAQQHKLAAPLERAVERRLDEVDALLRHQARDDGDERLVGRLVQAEALCFGFLFFLLGVFVLLRGRCGVWVMLLWW